MKNKTVILSTALCLLPILLGLALYDQLPAQVPTHFDLTGTPNGWSSRPMAVFGIPAFMAAANLLCHWGMSRARSDGSKVAPDIMVNLVGWIMGGLSMLIVPMSLFIAIGVEVPVNFIMGVLLGVLFLVIGNYLPKCKMNPYIGIKLPWTYSSEENWFKTHRLGGFVWVVAGLVLLVNTWLGSETVLLVTLFAAILIPCVYSYYLYKKERK